MAQKWANNDILISGGTYLGPKLKKKKPLSSIFDIEAPFQRYLPKSEILPILGSTLIFHFFMKFGQMVQVSKKMTLTYNRGEPQSRNGETAVFASGPKSQNGPKIHLLPIFFFKAKKTNVYLGKRYFFVFTTFHA